MAEQWFVHRNGARLGPYRADEIKSYVAEGRIEGTDLVWREGMADWLPAHQALALPLPPRADRVDEGRRSRDEEDDWDRSIRKVEEPAGPAQFPGRLISPGFFLSALFMFFLPWVNVRCDGFTVASQSGLQLCLGNYSQMDQRLDQGFNNNPQVARLDQETVKPAPLVISYVLLIIAGLVVGLAIPVGLVRLMSTGACAGAALVLLMIQVIVGFPIQEPVERANQAQAVQVQNQNNLGFPNMAGPAFGPGPNRLSVGTDAGFWLALLVTAGVAGGLSLEHFVVFAPRRRRRRRDWD